MKRIKSIIIIIIIGLIACGGYEGYRRYYQYRHENVVLKKIINRLEADTRAAEILVTEVKDDKRTGTKNSKYIEAWFGLINVEAGIPK